jgi:formamidopyrimidine-DNA glycosylase
MPELPEVETVRVGLSEHIVGLQVCSVWFDWPKSFPNDPEIAAQYLIGAMITSVTRRGKVLCIGLDSGYSLLVHLKMTGQMVVRSGNYRFGGGHPNDSLINKLPDNSTRVILHLAENTAEKQQSATGNHYSASRWQHIGMNSCQANTVELFFNDQRKFGWMKLHPTPEIDDIPFFQLLGPEPLATSFSADLFIERARARNNTRVKALLLDQKFIAGVGNIYADESLWGARIHPRTRIAQLDDQQLTRLYQAVKSVLQLSIRSGGSSDKNYVDAEGNKGSYLQWAQVFRREGQPCSRCSQDIVKIRVAGRGTHICMVCQMELA